MQFHFVHLGEALRGRRGGRRETSRGLGLPIATQVPKSSSAWRPYIQFILWITKILVLIKSHMACLKLLFWEVDVIKEILQAWWIFEKWISFQDGENSVTCPKIACTPNSFRIATEQDCKVIGGFVQSWLPLHGPRFCRVSSIQESEMICCLVWSWYSSYEAGLFGDAS